MIGDVRFMIDDFFTPHQKNMNINKIFTTYPLLKNLDFEKSNMDTLPNYFIFYR